MAPYDEYDNRQFKPAANSPDLPALPASSPNLANSYSASSTRRQQFSGPSLPSNPRNGSSNGNSTRSALEQVPNLPPSNGYERQWNRQEEANVGNNVGREDSSWKENNQGRAPSTKKVNPLTDLIRTEELYVEDLGVIIKRVAAAWSRTNFPPAELDVAFRAVESVYRVNKGLLRKLTDIGPTPSSPKALGDLLMGWVPAIQESYTRYTETFLSNFDTFNPVQSNDKLHTILAQLEWPATIPDQGDRVSLDILFSLPFERIRYYKKLFAKLLKSTQEGRSDHALLVNANFTLDVLLEKSEDALSRSVGSTVGVIGFSESAGPSIPAGMRDSSESKVPSASSSSERFSSASSAATSTALFSGPPRIEDLERRLSTERALDIFTMLPKKCKLQMAAPNLPFTRALRQASDVKLSFYPLSDPTLQELVINRAYVFLLTDLFLICSKMTGEERQAMKGVDGQGPDMWLMYPPLAGKHLRVSDGREVGELIITVMKKEKLTFRTESKEAAASWKAAFEDTISFGVSQGIRIKTDQLPPVGSQSPQSANLVSGYPSSTAGRSPPLSSTDRTPMPNNYDDNRDGFRRADSQNRFNDRPEFNQYEERPPPPRKQNIYDDAAQAGSSHSIAASLRPRSSSHHAPTSPSFHVSQASENYNPPELNHFAPYSSPSTGGSSNGPFTPTMNNYNQAPPPNEKIDHFTRSPSHSPSFAPYPADLGPLPIPNRDPSKRSDDERNLSPASMGRRLDMSRSGSVNTDYEDYGKSFQSNGSRIHSGTSSQRLSEPSLSAPGSAYGDYRSLQQSKSFNDYTQDDSPPPSPTEKDITSIIAQMRCKVFLQQHHASWKSLGTAKLKLYLSSPSNTKQLVVESDKSDKKTFVSTIVLTDGVEKVGKTGIAIELSDKGARTGIIYMLQMKTEQSALGLFDQLLLDSDRGAAKRSGR